MKAIAVKCTNDSRKRRQLELRWHFWRSASLLGYERLPPKINTMSTEQKKAVQDFYMDASMMLPLRRTVTATGKVKTLVQMAVLSKTTAQLHSDFVQSN